MIVRPTAALAACVALAAPVASSRAQQVEDLAAGARVRLNGRCQRTGTTMRVYSGELAQPLSPELRPDRDTVVFTPGTHPSVVPASQVFSLDVGTGRRSRAGNAGRGALMGAGVGALTGVALGLIVTPSSGGDGTITRPSQAVIAGLLLTVPGAVLGFLAGVSTDTEEWTPVVTRCPGSAAVGVGAQARP